MFHVEQKIEFLQIITAELKIPITADQIEKLLQYADLIKDWNKRVHLISKNDIDFVLERHIVPSLFFVKILQNDESIGKKGILDLGTGAGLPGCVVSILKPDWSVILLDSSRKKTLFLKQVKKTLKLSFSVVCARYEEYVENNTKQMDWIVARAVAPLGQLIQLVAPQLREGTKLLTLKGKNFSDELHRSELDEFQIASWAFEELSNENEISFKNKCLLKVEKAYG
ncbi:MAG TPA: 16S rRNA (guanine(527)-N(7))-methyltransferase RsmG [Caldithrix abyssi]|uniref:Ribosomal RNA small subunit methyltransferase G n=1 Tax=Caldithrix abyssi TaxID=187145 RepID=A0A7V5H3Q8_CALAY|nr:16S rRNA (guanine(527)-N(7))-methyltransferase RsmG [Caldithrix abyssi]